MKSKLQKHSDQELVNELERKKEAKDEFRFTHEKTKKERGIDAHVSTPDCLAQLLTQLLGIDKVQGKIIYDCCFGVGGLSQHVNTEKNILIGDDKEIKYLEQGQKNIPKAILFSKGTIGNKGQLREENFATANSKTFFLLGLPNFNT